MFTLSFILIFFFFNDTATTEIYTLSLHDALPILRQSIGQSKCLGDTYRFCNTDQVGPTVFRSDRRSEEHTSELQSQSNLVCRLLLEKKKKKQRQTTQKITTDEIESS